MKKSMRVSIKVLIMIGVVVFLFLYINPCVVYALESGKEKALLKMGKEDKVDNTSQDGESGKEKVVYLTFDDGPSYKITNKLLDILKEKEVKATFFVVGKEIAEREDILKRIYEEGHSIGLHTFSHNFKIIYKDEQHFIEEMEKSSELIKSLLNIEPKAIRFPGGSAGVLSKDFLDKLHRHGYRVYDWNVDLYDGVNPNLSVERLINNAKKAKGNQDERFILAHCNYNNGNTCKALGAIIDYYKEKGFVFKAIDDKTEEYYYKFRK